MIYCQKVREMRNLAFYGPFLPTSGPTPMSAKRWKMYPHNALTPLAVRNFSASFWRFTRPNVPLRGEIKCRKRNFSWVQISSFEIFYRHNPSQKPPRANKKNFKWFEAIFLLNINEMSDPLFSEFAPQFKMASIMWNLSIAVGHTFSMLNSILAELYVLYQVTTLSLFWAITIISWLTNVAITVIASRRLREIRVRPFGLIVAIKSK